MTTFTLEEYTTLDYFYNRDIIKCPRCGKEMRYELKEKGKIVWFECTKPSCGYDFHFTQEKLEELRKKARRHKEKLKEDTNKLIRKPRYS
ncbi:hypothetical protein KAX35_09495 [candidate division WOR-3 bacterium]|nr:hypothetical protein [candidate division WOR-3 bacterium]